MRESDRGRFTNGSALNRRALSALKYSWIAVVVAVAAWYLVTNWGELLAYSRAVGPIAALAAMGFLVLGRALLAAVSRMLLAMFGTDISLSRSFYIHALSQLGKYVPGAIWHLVGRVAMYRRLGMSTSRGAAAIAVENGVLLGSGLCLGTGLAISSLLRLIGQDTLGIAPTVIVAGTGLGLWWLAVSQLGRRLVRRYGRGAHLPTLRTFSLAVAFWATFGVAFWLMLPSAERSLDLLPIATGTFALAWVAGYVSPFAPAGIGVREGIIVLLMGPLVGVPMAAGTAAGSRIIWTLQELLTAPLAAAKLAEIRKPASRDADTPADTP